MNTDMFITTIKAIIPNAITITLFEFVSGFDLSEFIKLVIYVMIGIPTSFYWWQKFQLTRLENKKLKKELEND